MKKWTSNWFFIVVSLPFTLYAAFAGHISCWVFAAIWISHIKLTATWRR